MIVNCWWQMQNGQNSTGAMQLMEQELLEVTFTNLFRTNCRTAHGAANRAVRPSGL